MENEPMPGAPNEGRTPEGKQPLQLYNMFSPNGKRVTILLEELGVAYDAWLVGMFNYDKQYSPALLHLNPSENVPMLLDSQAGPDKNKFSVIESGAIMIYLAEKYPEKGFLPSDLTERSKVMQWLMWQMGSVPYFGQFGHFYKYAEEEIPHAMDRYTKEVKRVLYVLDKQLGKGKYVAGDNYSIADMAIFPWVECLKVFYGAGEFLEMDEYENMKRWFDELSERPAVKIGMKVNDVNGPFENYSTDGNSATMVSEETINTGATSQ